MKKRSERTVKPILERLEDRLAPAVVNWDGGGDNASWQDSLNWEGDLVPGLLDDPVITPSITVNVPAAVAVRSLQSNGGLNVNGSLAFTAPSLITGALSLNGSLDLQPGAALVLRGGGTTTGSITLATSSTLEFGVGSFSFTSTSSLSGAGTVRFTGGNVTLAGDYNISGSTNISDGTVEFNAPATTAAGSLSWGTLAGSGTLTIGSSFDWGGGTMAGSGVTFVAAGAQMNLTATSVRYLEGTRTLRNAGTIRWTDSQAVYESIQTLTGQTTIDNLAGANFEVYNDGFLHANPSGSPASSLTFNNAGIFRKLGTHPTSPTATTLEGMAFNNTGLVSVTAGTLRLLGSGSSSGSLTVSAGATLDFAASTYTVAAGSTLTAAGTVVFSGGNTTIAGTYNVSGATNLTGGTANFNSSATTATGSLNWGTLAGSGTFTIGSSFDWGGGTMAGSGVTFVAAGAQMNLTATSVRYLEGTRTLRNAGTIRWTDSQAVYESIQTLTGQTTIDNLTGANFEVYNDGFLHANPSGSPASSLTFNNAGIFRKLGTHPTNPGATTLESLAFNNTGLVSVTAGTLRLLGTGTSSGDFSVSAGAVLDFAAGQHDFVNEASLAGSSGLVRFSGADLNFAGDHQLNAPNLFSGGSIGGPGLLSVNYAPFVWEAGTLQGSGPLVIASHLSLQLPGDGDRILADRYLQVSGSVNWSAKGTIKRKNGAGEIYETFTNEGIPGNSSVLPPATPPTYNAAAANAHAAGLYRAMYGGLAGVGTTEEQVYGILENRTAAQIADIQAAYAANYKTWNSFIPGWVSRDLVADLNGDFSGDERTRVQHLLLGNQDPANRVQADVAALRYALSGADDEAAIFRILEAPNAAAVIVAYNATGDLHLDLSSDLSGLERDRALALYWGNRAEADAHALRYAMFGGLGLDVDEEAVYAVFRGRTPGEILAIRAAYQSLYYPLGPSGGIDIDFAAKLDPSELSYVGALMSGDTFEIAVRRLRLAFDNDGDGSTADSDGTDEDAVWQTLNGLRSDQRAMVAQLYRKRFGTEVREDINSEFEDNTVFGKALTKTLAYWERGGLSLAQRIHFALAGWGTDDPAIQAAIAEMRGLSAGKIAELKTEYQALFGESLQDALSGDLYGSDWTDAQEALLGPPTTIKEAYERAEKLYDSERTGFSLNTLIQDTFNDHGDNLDRNWQRVVAAYTVLPATARTHLLDNLSTLPAAERAQVQEIQRLLAVARGDVETYREARAAAANIIGNVVGTAAGMLVVWGSAGIATPLVIALAAGAGGAFQALTYMGIQGAFIWEELPATFVNGAVSGATVAISFPAAARQAILAGTAKVGVLRQVAGTAFAGGAISAGVGTALSENTWANGFVPGLVDMGLAAGVGGFTGTALAATGGAGLQLLRTTLPFARTLITTTGTAVVNVFDGAWVRMAVSAIRTNGQTVGAYLQATLASWATKVDDVANRILAWAAADPESTLRQAIATVVDSSGWGSARIGFVTEAAIDIANAQRPNLAGLGQAGIRNAIEERMGILMMSMADAVEVVRTHVASVGTTLSDAAVDGLALRLGALQNADDAAVRLALADIGVTTPSDSLVLFLRRKVNGTVQPVPWRRIDEGAVPDMELVDRAMALRMRQGLLTEAGMSGNNVAVAKVEIDGVVDYIEALNTGGGGPHSEELIATEIIRLRGLGRTVVTLELFTERAPCLRSAGCRQMIAQHLPEARVFRFAPESGEEAAEELWSIYSR